jgi:hypothetical protein
VDLIPLRFAHRIAERRTRQPQLRSRFIRASFVAPPGPSISKYQFRLRPKWTENVFCPVWPSKTLEQALPRWRRSGTTTSWLALLDTFLVSLNMMGAEGRSNKESHPSEYVNLGGVRSGVPPTRIALLCGERGTHLGWQRNVTRCSTRLRVCWSLERWRTHRLPI